MEPTLEGRQTPIKKIQINKQLQLFLCINAHGSMIIYNGEI